MQQTLITNVQGKIAANTLTELAKISRQAGAHWLTCKLIQLDGQFSALIKLEIDTEKLLTLQQALSQAMPQLSFQYHEIAAVPTPHTITKFLTLDCLDRQGLTHDIQHLLMDIDAQIDEFEHSRMMVSSIGETVYRANIRVRLVEDMSDDELTRAIENISHGMRVTVEPLLHS
ncbi:hypothetical protein FJQ87_15450 [Shewanella sp. SNU WT4]|uniref:ACT domain-containing protein n=1 Tax=Shewanella sp. SNU WT4 TaxID=2590015 RepID=UPI0011263D63|nr:ACT domain-containing protein [Shewanella sp. SNU WT4]QDF67881.1 hypothetical protein FJQ87_15450 [Shewanella sp. SNU WT4]